MKAAIYKNNVPFKKYIYTAGMVLVALLISMGCGTTQPIIITQKADSQGPSTRSSAHKAYEYCENQTAPHAPTWSENLNTVSDAMDEGGEIGRKTGSKVDQVQANDSDSGAQWGETAGLIFGALGAVQAIVEQDQYRQKKVNECMEALGYEIIG